MKEFKIGYTTGVFDLFHVGHLNILKKAKEQCDFLIVGVSTDELVMRYKNKQPVIPFEDRQEIIKGIKCVDQVVPQSSRDKFAAWEKLKFNAMFVGDDWKGNELFTEVENKFKEVGVKTVYFPYTTGVSSTIVRQKIGH
ncbi:MAG TPA: adenylyltransferase/cytidyltransferase family protein [Virgibacillus sp.]|nr:adenylyltransferase/cytidyltransferase family protein [Virgibacillus sp.]